MTAGSRLAATVVSTVGTAPASRWERLQTHGTPCTPGICFAPAWMLGMLQVGAVASLQRSTHQAQALVASPQPPTAQESLMRPGLTEILIILGIALLIFGAGRLADIGKGLGEGIRNFKKGLTGDDEPKGRLPAGKGDSDRDSDA